jgi:hypothetical protein
MKSLLFGIVLIVILGVGGLVYRNAVEHPTRPISCPMDAEICPDGTSVSRAGLSCTFPVCPSPNVLISGVGIAFAVPTGFSDRSLPDAESVGAYEMLSTSPAGETTADLIIRRYEIIASTTALETIKKTAISGTSGAPVGATSFSSTVLGSHRFTVVSIERFEGVVDTAYYLARTTDVLRFDALDRGVANWTDSNLDLSTLPAHAALVKLLSTLQGE